MPAVYLLRSKKSVPYVGKTLNLRRRMAQHRHAIKFGHGDGTKLAKYYRKKGNNFAQARVRDLYKPRGKNVKQKLEKKKKQWIKKYNSVRKGLNSRHY